MKVILITATYLENETLALPCEYIASIFRRCSDKTAYLI